MRRLSLSLFSDVSERASRRRIRQDHTVHSVRRLPRDFHIDSSHIWPDARVTVRGLKVHSIVGPGYEVWRIERSDELNSMLRVEQYRM